MDETDSCFQKPPMRRALGELTNSPRLLDHPGTPTKQVGVKLSPAITPTHNLKLLTELAAKVANGGSSSARQTLQFEDVDTSRYTSEPVYLPLDTNSPHRDHSYGSKNNLFAGRYETVGDQGERYNPNMLSAEFEPKDEFCTEFVKLEPVVSAEEARLETGFEPAKPRRKPNKGPGAIEKSLTMAPVPLPLPQESALFIPPSERGNRKDKSLGLLADRMLQNYPYALTLGEYAEVQLDDTAKLLNTERRRIYDIVNVFEAVQIMSKVGKNVYNWHGRTYLMQSLAWLRQLGVKLGMQEQYRVAKEQERDMADIENMSPLQSPRLVSPMMSPYGSPGMSPYGSPNDPNATSMGINTQKFLMLFLVMPRPCQLTLDFAARVIHGPNPSEKAKVTRVRRLYDIANILQSLGLIKKVQIPEGKGKKPAFEYVGPMVDNISLTDEQKRSMPSTRQKNSLLAVGKNLASLPDRDDSLDSMRLNGATMKRARSLSGDRQEQFNMDNIKLQRTRSVGREGLAVTSLLELGEVCEREREKFNENNEETTTPFQPNTMKPPTPGCSSSSLVAPSSPLVDLEPVTVPSRSTSHAKRPVVRELSATKETNRGDEFKDEILEEKTTAVFVNPKWRGKSQGSKTGRGRGVGSRGSGRTGRSRKPNEK